MRDLSRLCPQCRATPSCVHTACLGRHAVLICCQLKRICAWHTPRSVALFIVSGRQERDEHMLLPFTPPAICARAQRPVLDFQSATCISLHVCWIIVGLDLIPRVCLECHTVGRLRQLISVWT